MNLIEVLQIIAIDLFVVIICTIGLFLLFNFLQKKEVKK